MEGIKNFLQIINENWVNILVCIGVVIGLVEKTKAYFHKTKEERYEAAKQQIKQIILSKITTAEVEFAEWKKSGEIKRSQVIEEIYTQYPILEKIINQDEVIAWLDSEINNSLTSLKKVIEGSQKEIDEVTDNQKNK